MYRKLGVLVNLFCFSACAMAANPNDLAMSLDNSYTKESQALFKSLEEQIIATLIAVSEQERKAGKSLNNLDYQLDIPAKEHTDIGMLISFDNGKKGFNVISVTDGGAAHKAGLRAGDVINAINGVEVSTSEIEKNQTIKYLWDFKPQQVIDIQYSTNGVTKNTSFAVPGIKVPSASLTVNFEPTTIANQSAAEQCGQLELKYWPEEEGDIYPLTLLKVNGQNVHSNYIRRKFAAGNYRFEFGVVERDRVIPGKVMDVKARETYSFTIEPNVKYYVGAYKSVSDKARSWQDSETGSKIKRRKNKENYTPVIWRTEKAECRQ